MKKTVLILAALVMSFGAFAQESTAWWSFDFEDGLENGQDGLSLTLNLNAAEGSGISSDDVKNGESSLKIVTKDAADFNYWNTQLQFPEFPIVAGDSYRLTFWARSDEDGTGETVNNGVARFSTGAAAQIGPPAGGSGPAPDRYWANFWITSEWKEFSNFSYSSDPNDPENTRGSDVLVTYESEVASFNLDLGGIINNTYYFDDFLLVNLDGSDIPTAIKDVKLTAKDIAFGVAGGIVVKGQQADVYSIDGRLVKQAKYGFNALNPGIYVVKSQGVAAKFIVK